MGLDVIENLIFKRPGAEMGMDMHADFTVTVGVCNSDELPARGFPGGSDLLERRGYLAGKDEMPAPIVEAGDVPAVFEAVVEEEDFAQEVTGAKVIRLSGEVA